MDEDLTHWKDYTDAQHIIFAKHHHDKEMLEWEAKMYIYSIRDMNISTSSTHNPNQGQAKDGGGDGGDDGGSVGATNLVQDNSDDDDGADMGRRDSTLLQVGIHLLHINEFHFLRRLPRYAEHYIYATSQMLSTLH